MPPTLTARINPSDLRAERARRQAPIYWIAARIGVHSTRLGRMLNEHLPMPPEIATQVLRALEEFGADRASAR